MAPPPALTYAPRFNEPRFWDLFVFLMLGGREPNRTFLMGASLFRNIPNRCAGLTRFAGESSRFRL